MDFQSPQNGMYDPSSFVDPGAIAGGQMNGTRAYPMSSIPQKRDSTGAALSRSQTPSQQPQFGFQQGFSHTPSPTMQNQHFRPGQMPPQRMQTASPAQNPHAPQMSPMGFQGSPMNQGFDPNAGGQFPVQSVQLSQHLQSRQQEAQRQYAMRLQAQQQQLGNLAASNMAAQQRHQQGQMPGQPMQHPGMQQNMMPGQMQPQQVQNTQHFLKNVGALMAQNRRQFNPHPQIAGRVINLHQLYAIVMKFKGYRYVTQTQAWPRVAQMIGIQPQQFPNSPEELRMIYEQNLGLYETAYLQKQQQQQMKGGPMQGQMPAMGQQMSPNRPPMAGAPNTASAQHEYLQQLQRKAAMQQQQRPSDPAIQPPQQPFDQAAQPPQPQQTPQPQPQQQPPPQQSTPLQNNANLANLNGRSTPQADPNAANQHRKSMSRQLEGTPVQGQEPPHPSISPAKPMDNLAAVEPAAPTEPARRKPVVEEDDGSRVYQPAYRYQDKWGGLDFESDNFKGMIQQIESFKPNVPAIQEMGVIDIRALTMSIRSGLHAETRVALDTLARLTYDANVQLDLGQCDDLIDVLVEFAENQLEVLASDNPEVTDILDLTPYEDVLHHCRAEAASLQEFAEFGTKEYDLDRTADRLLAITTVFRNLSFLEINHGSLASSAVLKFLSSAIRLVGTRVLLLRSHINTFDFMKDLITFFSNTSAKMVLPSREDAYTILHFLCAFAPCPRPTVPVKFMTYNPQVHRYLPSAVDSLAKLLARDDPNRTFYKQIFVNEAQSTPPYDLLTRAFGLAIAVIPDRTEGRLFEVFETRPKDIRHFEARVAEARKAYLMQGMLAADILASLAPGTESGICRSWLESEDGWSTNLLKFSMSLSATDAAIPQPPPATNHRQRTIEPDREGFYLIVHRALSTLKRLGEKSKGGDSLVKSAQTNGHKSHDEDEDEDDDEVDMEIFNFGGSAWKVKADFLPKKETLLGALLTATLDNRSLKQFCTIGYLDE